MVVLIMQSQIIISTIETTQQVGLQFLLLGFLCGGGENE